jgi:ATP-dependent helicase/nuclease subunit A
MIKSCAVLSPAGSGKTERLARRYIDLLRTMDEPKPERILTITFTRKAAAEMKERIFRILKEEDQSLYQVLKSKVLKLRITTIDAFCLSLLQRFALKLGLEPEVEVLADPDDLWTNVRYDTLMTIAEAGRRDPDFPLLLDLVTEGQLSGWPKLASALDCLYANRAASGRAAPMELDFQLLMNVAGELRGNPVGGEKIPDYDRLFPTLEKGDTPPRDVPFFQELRSRLATFTPAFLTSTGGPRSLRRKPEVHEWYQAMYRYWGLIETRYSYEQFRRRFDLFARRFLKRFQDEKREQGRVDFSDLELEAYYLLTRHEDWSNILLAFDEHTDHVLVDEFQDTSFLQWGIISKLTEEWQAGQGRKQEQGIEPTIFLVGDDKQSIYLFRNAHAEVFDQARTQLEGRLGPERFEFKPANENYRSLQAIIDFTNHVFSKVMAPLPEAPAWQTRYESFVRKRECPDPGTVELLLAASTGKMEARRSLEAELIARRIQTLVGNTKGYSPRVYEDKQAVECSYRHVTVLLRSRTHLSCFERAFTEFDIPYLVQRGTGFYNEPEILFLMNLVAVLVDPYDDFNLYALLKSPFFDFSERDLFFVAAGKGRSFMEKLTTERVTSYKLQVTSSELSTFNFQLPTSCAQVIDRIQGWVRQVWRRPLAEIVTEVLEQQQAWKALWEPQRHANVRKFIGIIEQAESEGLAPLRIRQMLDTAASAGGKGESKATVDVRGQDAVQIMTIHAAKGLQFPIVFCPELDNRIDTAPDELLVDELDPENVRISYQPDSGLRKLDPVFEEYRLKMLEEEKRIFYVAVTRARDALFLSALLEDTAPVEPSCLKWLWDALPLQLDGERFQTGVQIPGFKLTTPDQVREQAARVLAKAAAVRPEPPAPVYIGPVSEPERLRIAPVTRDTTGDRKRHGEDTIAFGVVMHRVLELIANGGLNPNASASVQKETSRLFAREGIEAGETKPEAALIQLVHLRDAGLLDIALPQPGGYAELPFMLRKGQLIYSGRIDRLIVKEDAVEVYDYKTFPVLESELPVLVEEYRSQMQTYLDAAAELFPGRAVRGFILFTALPKLVEMRAKEETTDERRNSPPRYQDTKGVES